MKKIKIILIIFMLLVFFFCSKQQKKNETILKQSPVKTKTEYKICYSVPYSPIDFRPYKVYFNYNNTYYDLVFNTLIEADQARNIKPELAIRWKINDAFTEFSFQLRKNVKFSNGKELTADDVIFTFEEMVRRAYSKFRELRLIQGVDEFYSGKAKYISGLKKIDDYNIVFKLKKRFKFFIYFLSAKFTSIIPKDYGGLTPEKFSKEPIGSGPYYLKEYNDNFYIKHKRFHKYVFIKNNKYFFKSNKNNKFTFFLPFEILTKDLYYLFDITISNSQNQIIEKLRKDFTIINSPYMISTILCLNPYHNKVLKNKELRQMINYSINREQLVNDLNNKYIYPAHSIIPRNMFGNNPYYKIKYSQLNLLKLKNKNKKISFTLYYYDKQEKIVNSLEKQLKSHNILLKKVLVEFNELYNELVKFDSKIINFLPDYSSTYNFLIQFYIKEGLANDFKISNKKILDKIKELPMLNLEKESLTYSLINKMIEEESIYLPLTYTSLVYTIKGKINCLNFKFPSVIDYCTLELESE